MLTFIAKYNIHGHFINVDIHEKRQISFKSFNHPVRPFKINTGSDTIYFKELDYKRPAKKRLLKEVATFFLDNFANQSSHPFWETCRRGTKTFIKSTYKDYISESINTYKELLKNPDTTVMLGRNRSKKLTAAILAEPLNLTPLVKDNNTLYIDSIAVDKVYRGNHIGNQLMKNVINSTKNRYTDVFLVSYKESETFYKKQGFTPLNPEHKGQKKIIKSLAKERLDYPEYASFLTKTIDESKPRWFQKFKKWYYFG